MTDPALRGAAPSGFEVVIEPWGLRFNAPAGVPLLQAAREAGLVLPSSCRNGTCRACLGQLRSGRVTHAVEWPGLSADEKAAGCILPCVALACTPLVIEIAGAAFSPRVSQPVLPALPRTGPGVAK